MGQNVQQPGGGVLAGVSWVGQLTYRARHLTGYEKWVTWGGIVVLWQALSYVLPPILAPSVQRVAAAVGDILTDRTLLGAMALTYTRILVALAVSFLLGLALGLLAGFNDRFDRYASPAVHFIQGIPALSWVVFAVIWFRDLEVRILFVILMSTTPIFFYQIRDGLRGVSKELWDMVLSFRPTRRQLLQKLVFPALVPAIFTGWKINLGGGTRVAIVAELVGGISGIGYRLRLSQEIFRMDYAIAWTLTLVAFVLATEAVLALGEGRLLRWRPRLEAR
mgnify:CR=1 FL=1